MPWRVECARPARLRPKLVNNRDGEPIAALVFRMARVPTHPLWPDLVDLAQPVELLPQLYIHDRPLLSPPAAPLPAVDPLGQPLHEVLRVAHEAHAAWPLQLLEALDRSEQLHAVVGRPRLATGAFALDSIAAQDEAPAAWARVSRACAIGEELDKLLRVHRREAYTLRRALSDQRRRVADGLTCERDFLDFPFCTLSGQVARTSPKETHHGSSVPLLPRSYPPPPRPPGDQGVAHHAVPKLRRCEALAHRVLVVRVCAPRTPDQDQQADGLIRSDLPRQARDGRAEPCSQARSIHPRTTPRVFHLPAAPRVALRPAPRRDVDSVNYAPRQLHPASEARTHAHRR